MSFNPFACAPANNLHQRQHQQQQQRTVEHSRSCEQPCNALTDTNDFCPAKKKRNFVCCAGGQKKVVKWRGSLIKNDFDSNEAQSKKKRPTPHPLHQTYVVLSLNSHTYISTVIFPLSLSLTCFWYYMYECIYVSTFRYIYLL